MLRRFYINTPGTESSRNRKIYTENILFGIEFEMKFRSPEECERMFYGIKKIKKDIFSVEFDRDVAGFIKQKDEYGDYRVFENSESILRGFEIVMKPCKLNALKSYNKIFKDIFKEQICYPHITSCHVHISAHWMDELFIKLLYQRLYHIQKYVMDKYQPIFYNTFEGWYRERRRRHAISNLIEMPNSVFNDKRKGTFFDFLFNGCDPHDINKYNPARYVWVNFVSLFLYGTLEVRLPETIDQAVDIANYMLGIFKDINLKLERDNDFSRRRIEKVIDDYFAFYRDNHEEDSEEDGYESDNEEDSEENNDPIILPPWRPMSYLDIDNHLELSPSIGMTMNIPSPIIDNTVNIINNSVVDETR